MTKGSAPPIVAIGAAWALAFVTATEIASADNTPPPPAATEVSVSVSTPAAATPAAATPAADASTKKATDAAIAVNPWAGDPAAGTSTDVFEKAGKSYYFIGARYRGTIIPQAFENLFVNGGKTFYSNTAGLEVDIRKDNFSIIPAISYTSYGTGGNVLFLQKNEQDIESNWSVVNSNLGAIYLTADLLWSAKVAPNVDFEYGFGVGLGVLFGNLQQNWVYATSANTPGALPGDNGAYYAPCPNVNTPPNNKDPGTGCSPSNHTSGPAKVNGYVDPYWTGGGSVPNIFPHISIPQLGLRFKFLKQLEARFGVGFSITGFWFGFSANYGLEQPEKK